MISTLICSIAFGATTTLNDLTYEGVKSYLVPAPAETLFENIPWYSSLWAGIVKGQDQDKPILLWCMNGHPLGCT